MIYEMWSRKENLLSCHRINNNSVFLSSFGCSLTIIMHKNGFELTVIGLSQNITAMLPKQDSPHRLDWLQVHFEGLGWINWESVYSPPQVQPYMESWLLGVLLPMLDFCPFHLSLISTLIPQKSFVSCLRDFHFLAFFPIPFFRGLPLNLRFSFHSPFLTSTIEMNLNIHDFHQWTSLLPITLQHIMDFGFGIGYQLPTLNNKTAQLKRWRRQQIIAVKNWFGHTKR